MSEINIDITKLSGYEDLPFGATYDITVVAKGDPNYYIDSDHSNPVSYVKPTPTYAITYTLNHVSGYGTIPVSIQGGSTVTVTVETDEYYKTPTNGLQSVAVVNATAENFIKISETQFSFDISNPTGAVSVEISAELISYNIVYQLTRLARDGSSPTVVYANALDNVYVKLDADPGYAAPGVGSVRVYNATLSEYTNNGTYCTFKLDDIRGNVQISASTSVYYDYPITVVASHLIPDQGNPQTVNIGEAAGVILTFTAEEGYLVPQDGTNIVVTNATKRFYSKTSDNKTCYLQIAQPTGDVGVGISGDAIVYNITWDLDDIYVNQSVIPTTIATDETLTINLIAPPGYKSPSNASAVSVQNATKNNFSSSGGSKCSFTLSAPTSDVTISTSGVVDTNHNYLIFSSPSSFSLGITNNRKYCDGVLQKATDDCDSWTNWDCTTSISSRALGGKHYICLRGSGNTYITGLANATSVAHFSLNGSDISCEGNIENLLDYATVASNQHPTMAAYCFSCLFYNNTSLISAPTLAATTCSGQCYWRMFQGCSNLASIPSVLPATTLATYCYAFMFANCTSITTAPTLPATQLTGGYCYYYMFSGCSSLVNAPTLPSSSVTTGCYKGMFFQCISLVYPPALPATSLGESCYESMFQGCTSLALAPELPATLTQYNTSCYLSMFAGCTSLVSPPALTSLQLSKYCYSGMFQGCTNLAQLPTLPAVSLSGNDACYLGMFRGCSKIKLSETQTLEYTTAYQIPDGGWAGASEPSRGFENMFLDTGGTFTGRPTVNTVYYTSNLLVPGVAAPSIFVSANTLTIVDNSGRADSFDIYVDGVYGANVVAAQQGNTTFDLSTISGIAHGQYTVMVRAKKSGYVDSAASNSVEWVYLPKQRLPAPTNISFDDSTNIVTFDRVEDAIKYKLYDTGGPLIGEIPQQLMTATISYNIANLSNFSALSVAGIHWLYLVACGNPEIYDDSYNSAIFLYVSMPTVSLGLSGSVLTISVEHSNLDNYIDYYTLYADESGNVMSRNIYSATYDLSEWLTTPGTYSVYVKVHFNIQEGRYSPYSSSVSYVVAPPSTGYTVSFSNSYVVNEAGTVEQCSLYLTYASGTTAEVPLEQSTARGTSYSNVTSMTLSASDSTYIEYVIGGVTDDLYTVEGEGILTLTGDCTITYCDGQECIAADTLVLMADGTQKQLGEIHTGDYILSYDWNTMQLVPNKVIYSSCEEPDWDTGGWDAPRYFKRVFSDGTVIKQAFAHRFYNREAKKFVYMEQWALGQHTYAYNNGQGKLVEYVDSEKVYQPLRFARITGENGTNYFANGLLTGDRHCPQNLILPPEEN